METNKEIDQAVARLRESRTEHEELEKADGQSVGRRWVLEDAEYPDVRGLAEFKLSGRAEHAWSVSQAPV